MRLISDEDFNKIKKDYRDLRRIDPTMELRENSKVITVNNEKIQKDLQAVADNSSIPNAEGKYQEHQMYLVLDRENTQITSIMGPPGTSDKTTIGYSYSPNNPASLVMGGDGRVKVLIGQAHGHPPAKEGMTMLKTMSEDFDKPTSQSLQIPIYGIDAMDGSTKEKATNIHWVTPDGVITNTVGKTGGSFNIGAEAMRIWREGRAPIR